MMGGSAFAKRIGLNLGVPFSFPFRYWRHQEAYSLANGMHPVTNIGFEQQHARVTRYYATLWLEATGDPSHFNQLQYSQTILMDIPIAGVGTVSFPHVTSNTLRKID
jgi:hypothetical protein